ncbi:MAG: 4-hydroxybutyrate CoA-transferase, partial [Bacteroidales bacterium]|nr:4-hydroxybutyrate CoA-transferase [Bacteroidales bacterium]
MLTSFKIVSAEEAVKVIKTDDRVHIHAIGCAPQKLIAAMCERGRRREFKNVRIQHLHTEGPAPYTAPEFEGVFCMESFFAGANVRKDTQAGYADYIPGFLQDTQRLIREGICRPNVALIQVSPPDKHGYVSLGCSV